ncbi:MAG: hypothetical protein R2712_03750 [Vicinamibacterales bacterium]
MPLADHGLAPVVAIGGVGGSGTRLFAQVLDRLGWYLGGDVNESADNLWFSLLFKRADLFARDARHPEFALAARIFRAAMTSARPLDGAEEVWLRGLTAERPECASTWLQQRVESIVHAARTTGPRSGPWG